MFGLRATLRGDKLSVPKKCVNHKQVHSNSRKTCRHLKSVTLTKEVEYEKWEKDKKKNDTIQSTYS